MKTTTISTTKYQAACQTEKYECSSDEWESFANVNGERQTKQNRGKQKKNRTFIKYSWKYSSVSVMVLRRRFRLPLPFCHVIQTHCIHEIPFWQSNFFFRSHLVLVIYLHLNRKKTWGVEKSLYFTKIDEQKTKKKNLLSRTVRLFHLSILMRIFGKTKKYTYKYRWHSWNEYVFLYIYSSCIERQSTKLKLTTIIYICGRLKYHWFNWWLMDRD